MSPITLKVKAAEEVDRAQDANFREDFLRAASHIGLRREVAVVLVEASSGQPFAACIAADLLPVMADLLVLAQHTVQVNGGSGCH